MEIDLGTAIVGSIVIAISASPFVYDVRRRKKRKNKLKESLTAIANHQNCQINEQEAGVNFIIAADWSNMFVFFTKSLDEQISEQTVNLREFLKCKVLNTSRTVKSNGVKHKVIDKLELSFIPAIQNHPEIKLEFYNSQVNLQLYEELQIIEKWSKLINDKLIQHH